MAIVDERGRLFGRWNLVDLVAMIVVLGLIPLAYAGYLLFRDKPPTITGISPAQVEEGTVTITIKGTNFRPYMRASAGNLQAREFGFKTTEEADLPFASLPAGVYDIILYDSAQERFRLPKALTVTRSALPSTKIVVVGAFGNLDAAGAAKITAGTELGGVGKVLSVGKPVSDITQVLSGPSLIGVGIPGALGLPATIELSCYVRMQGGLPYCVIDNNTIAPNILLTLPTPAGAAPFQVVRVRGIEPLEPIAVSIRVTGPSSVVTKIKAGDVDMGGTANPQAAQARVESVSGVRAAGDGTATADVKLIAQAQHHDQQWIYDSGVLRAGAPIQLRTASYEVRGIVTDIPPAESRPQP
jgi:hypothetical protein